MTGALCRALSGHAWRVSGPIVVLKAQDRRITFFCPRCETYRIDVWTIRGHIVRRSYDHGEAYSKFIKSHDRTEARESLLIRRSTRGEGKRTHLRSVPRIAGNRHLHAK